jgi:hypothetical protein
MSDGFRLFARHLAYYVLRGALAALFAGALAQYHIGSGRVDMGESFPRARRRRAECALEAIRGALLLAR